MMDEDTRLESGHFMIDQIHVSIEFDDEGLAEVLFPSENATQHMEVAEVGDNRYRLESVPMVTESFSFGDIVEAEVQDDGVLRVNRLVKKSNWFAFDLVLPQPMVHSEELRLVLKRVMEFGGHWERVFGGCLFIRLPPGVDYDPVAELMVGRGS